MMCVSGMSFDGNMYLQKSSENSNPQTIVYRESRTLCGRMQQAKSTLKRALTVNIIK